MTHREICLRCLQTTSVCYCAHIERFDPVIKFVVLIHPIEFRRRIATGRMSYLCLANSELIRGHDYTHDERVNGILRNPHYHPVILYPGQSSVNLSELPPSELPQLFPFNKQLVVFVIDGTWHTARKMLLLSKNLQGLPRVCFTPSKKSNFRVRKQPSELCYSTIEAIHHTIELLGPSQGFSLSSKTHDRLLFVFDKMVEKQLEFVRRSKISRHQLYKENQTNKV